MERMSTSYLGPMLASFTRIWLVDKHLGNFGNIGNSGNPGNAGNPGNPRNRGSVNYGYTDVFHKLLS